LSWSTPFFPPSGTFLPYSLQTIMNRPLLTILQPPKPQIAPPAEILQLAEHEIEPEAGG
jgi:hypothetical protein